MPTMNPSIANPVGARRPRPVRTALAAVTLLMLAGLALPHSARATLLVYEPFEYSPGGLAGASGGSGWSGNWVTHATPRFQVVTGSLAYPAGSPIASSGNSLARTDSTGQSSAATRTYNASTLFGGDMWFSFLIEPSSTNTGSDFRMQPLARSNANNGNFAGGLGVFASGANKEIQARIGATQGNNVPLPDNQTTLVVGRVALPNALGGSATVDIWLDPDQSFASLGAPDSTVTVANLGSATGAANLTEFNTAYFRYGLGWAGGYDELRIGTSFAAVAMPEPTRAMLLAIAGLGLLARRRRSSTMGSASH